MTQDEAREEYTRQIGRYNNAEDLRNSLYSSHTTTSDDIANDKSRKANLEEYVSNLDKIIRFIDKRLSNQLDRADKESKYSDEKYKSAVVLTKSNIHVADFSEIFKTLSKNQDTDILMAYNECIKERNRVNNVIYDLENSIKTATSRLNTLNSNINYYTRVMNDASSTMSWLRKRYNL